VSVRLGAAEHVEVLQVLLEAVGVAVEELVLVHRTVRGALTRRAVVGAVEDQGVVELAGLLQIVDDAADLNVGVLRETGPHLGHPAEQPLLVVVQLTPRTHVVGGVGRVLRHRVQRGQLGARWQRSPLDHPREHPLPVRLIPVVELALVLVDVLLRRMVRSVVGARTKPHEPRFRRRHRMLIAQHPQGLVGQVLGQVIAILGRVRRPDEVVVLDQVGVPLVGLAAEEPVEPVEPLRQRPFRAAAACGDVLLRHVVVLAEPERRIAVVLQDLPDRRALGRQPACGTGESVGALHDRRAPVHVVVASGEEGRPRR
jgi:hypothetical protein